MRFPTLARIAATSAVLVFVAFPANAWGPDGHEMINRLAAENLPTDVPAFVRDKSGAEVIEYLAPEPDRWRNKAEDELAQTQAADHFIDLEWADMVPQPWPKKRYDFIRALAVAQAAHPEMKLTPEKVGLQPWQTEEVWERLKVDFREYRNLKKAGKSTRGVETAILFDTGWLGHYVGDGSQPLHVSAQYNGWTGPNPNGYTTSHKIHWQVESLFVIAAANRKDVEAIVAKSKPTVIDDEWTQYLSYLHETGTHVEELYKLEKGGGFEGKGTPETRAFVDARLAAGAIELRDLIYSAWVHSADAVEEYKG